MSLFVIALFIKKQFFVHHFQKTQKICSSLIFSKLFLPIKKQIFYQLRSYVDPKKHELAPQRPLLFDLFKKNGV